MLVVSDKLGWRLAGTGSKGESSGAGSVDVRLVNEHSRPDIVFDTFGSDRPMIQTSRRQELLVGCESDKSYSVYEPISEDVITYDGKACKQLAITLEKITIKKASPNMHCAWKAT